MSKISSIHRRFVFRLQTWQPKYFVNPFYSPSLHYYWHATQLDIDLASRKQVADSGDFWDWQTILEAVTGNENHIDG